MEKLIVKDLAVTAELDRKAMAAVHGGMGMYGCAPSMPSYCAPSLPSYCAPSYEAPRSEFNFNASQSLGQSQNTLVNNGNNVAFASGITSTVTPHQTGNNTINFG